MLESRQQYIDPFFYQQHYILFVFLKLLVPRSLFFSLSSMKANFFVYRNKINLMDLFVLFATAEGLIKINSRK